MVLPDAIWYWGPQSAYHGPSRCHLVLAGTQGPPLVPPGLPRKFIKSIETARHRVSSFRNEVEDSELNSEQKVILQKAIDARFKKWLKETGKQRELDQLEKLSVSLKYSRISKQTTICH